MTRENIRAILECNFAGYKDDIIDIAVKNICEILQEPESKAITLDKVEQIRAEIEIRLQGVNIALEILVKDDPLIPRLEAAKTTLEEVLDIFDNH